jgi:hypothetical protein
MFNNKFGTIFIIMLLMIMSSGVMGCTNLCPVIPTPTPTTIVTPTNAPSTVTPTATPWPDIPRPQPPGIIISEVFAPSGWWGDYGDIKYDPGSLNKPKSTPVCIQITYTPKLSQGNGWAAICWQYPPNNSGNMIDGQNLIGNSKVTFWARGEKGGEKAEFKVGGSPGNYPDSIQPIVSTGVIVLSKDWQKYQIDLSNKDLSHVISGFIWATNKDLNPNGCTIYLDDVWFEL